MRLPPNFWIPSQMISSHFWIPQICETSSNCMTNRCTTALSNDSISTTTSLIGCTAILIKWLNSNWSKMDLTKTQLWEFWFKEHWTFLRVSWVVLSHWKLLQEMPPCKLIHLAQIAHIICNKTPWWLTKPKSTQFAQIIISQMSNNLSLG